MTYLEAIEVALAVKSYAEADAVCKSIEEDYDAISDRQYHKVRNAAINAAYQAIVKEVEQCEKMGRTRAER